MTVSVAGHLYRPGRLSDVGTSVVALIAGGRQWLDWASADPVARYGFADESALVGAIQTGLHGTSLVVLPVTGLAVGAVKLMTLSVADLRLLQEAESGAAVAPDPIQAMCRAHDIVPHSGFAGARAMLAELGVADAPLFQSVGLDAWRALLDLSDKMADVAHAREAAAFAIGKARTPDEFCDHCRIYLGCIPTLDPATDTPQARAAAADAALETLLPLGFAVLDCPKVDGLVAPWEVGAAIGEWRRMGRQIGFVRPSRLVQQVVAHGGYRGQTGADAAALMRDYVARAQSLLDAVELDRGLLSQDGAACRFAITNGTDHADIALTRAGLIVLNGFAPAAPG